MLSAILVRIEPTLLPPHRGRIPVGRLSEAKEILDDLSEITRGELVAADLAEDKN